MTTPRLVQGRYTLLAELGRGGMATVHRARDEVLGRDVALKILHPHLAGDPAFRARFLREGRAAATLSHPNVVAIHDLDADENGARLVMEVVDGPSMSEVLATRGRLSPGEALALLGPAADGLAAAHAAGLVHRDVKPANILIAADGTVKVGDFGLARAAASSTQTFGADVLVGSPHYLAPEAVDGGTLGATADVYGLGIVLFEVLTGRPPFQGDTPMATALQHTTGTVPPPSSLVPGISPAVDEVVRVATQHDPDERYADAAAFRAALTAAVPGGPLPVDLRGGRHHTVVMPALGLDPDSATDGATRVVLRNDVAEAKKTTPRRRTRRTVLLALALLLLVAGGAAAAWNTFLAPVTDIPAVIGLSPDAAATALRDAGFSSIVSEQGSNSLQAPVGTIAAVDPPERARKGTTLVLTLSLGPSEVVVPDVNGLEEPAASLRLRDANFEVDVQFAHDDLVAEGFAIRTDPAGLSIGRDGQQVVLFISLGPAPVQIPGLVGMTLEAANQALEELGLIGEVVEERFDENIAAGSIADQLPEAGTEGHRGDVVQMVVSQGGRPFALPDVRGQKEKDARRILEDLGLRVDVEDVSTVIPGRKDTVADTNPPPGTHVRSGDQVVLFVYD